MVSLARPGSRKWRQQSAKVMLPLLCSPGMSILSPSRRGSPMVFVGTHDDRATDAEAGSGGGRNSTISRGISAKRLLGMATSPNSKARELLPRVKSSPIEHSANLSGLPQMADIDATGSFFRRIRIRYLAIATLVAVTIFLASCGFSLQNPSLVIVKSPGVNVSLRRNSSTTLSTTGRSGSILSSTKASRYLC